MDYPDEIRLVIADESADSRQALRSYLQNSSEMTVIAEASDAALAVAVATERKPHVLVIGLPLLRAADADEFEKVRLAGIRTVVVIPAVEKDPTVEAFRLGAQGIVPIASASASLADSIRWVMSGRYWLDSDSAGVLVQAVREFLSQGSNTAKNDFGLTRRELEIVAKIASGRSNRAVGQEFSISERTVKHHLTNIYNKVGVSSRLQLALFAVNHRLMNQPALSFAAAAEDCCDGEEL